VALGNGETRTFLEDGDEVVMRAVSRGPSRARLGEVRGRICPSVATERLAGSLRPEPTRRD
jgi:fumarylacetoacetase